MPGSDDLDFTPALDAYVAKVEEFARERGDRVSFKEENHGAIFLGIETAGDGPPLSMTINYTP